MNRLIRNLMSILALIFACLSLGVQAQNIETATEAVKNMGLGWNLGNTLDANSQKVSDVTNDAYWGGQGLDSEYCWGQKPTTKPLFEMLKNAGFGAIRVPVTWYNHMDKDGKVNEAWMARVHEVVDYVIESGLYCIVNVHQDTGGLRLTWPHTTIRRNAMSICGSRLQRSSRTMTGTCYLRLTMRCSTSRVHGALPHSIQPTVTMPQLQNRHTMPSIVMHSLL